MDDKNFELATWNALRRWYEEETNPERRNRNYLDYENACTELVKRLNIEYPRIFKDA